MKIITDSAADLPKPLILEFNLHVIPTPVLIDGTDYLDGETILTGEFYSVLDNPQRDVKTYHINPSMFEEAFLPYAESGTKVLYLCFSTGIAGTYNAANLARESLLEQYPDLDLTIVDSKCASIGFGLLVYKLLCMQRAGASDQELLDAAYFYSSHIRHIFTVRTLAYLVKGGRLSKLKGVLGTTLEMRPVITLDPEGRLLALSTIRGQKRAYRALVDFVAEHGVSLEKQTVAFCHGEDRESLSYVTELFDHSLSCKDKLVSTVGCAIGAHTGRGIIGICFLDCDDPYAAYYV